MSARLSLRMTGKIVLPWNNVINIVVTGYKEKRMASIKKEKVKLLFLRLFTMLNLF